MIQLHFKFIRNELDDWADDLDAVSPIVSDVDRQMAIRLQAIY